MGSSLIFFLLLRPPPISTLFPYTTLFRSRVNGATALLPVGESVLVDVDVVELNPPQLLCEHVGVLAVAARTIDHDGQILIFRIAPLREQLVDLLVDVGFPHRIRTSPRDVSLLVDRGAAG